jgi:UDP-glucuronate decarboxylase
VPFWGAMASLNHRRHEESARESGRYDAKPEKGWGWVRRPVRYVLLEQRLWCVVLGVVLTSAFFILQPSYGFQYGFLKKEPGVESAYSSAYDLGHRRASEDMTMLPYAKQRVGIVSPGAKVPLGLQRSVKRIVVTGGAGFVGSHLVDRLMERGDNVIVVDNFFTGKKENVMHHFGNPRFELIRHDVVEPLLLEVDQIYHLACPASPVHYKFNPVKTIISSCTSPCNL